MELTVIQTSATLGDIMKYREIEMNTNKITREMFIVLFMIIVTGSLLFAKDSYGLFLGLLAVSYVIVRHIRKIEAIQNEC